MRLGENKTAKYLLFAGVFFLVLGAIEIPLGIKNSNSVVLGTLYILAAIVINTIVLYSVPVNITNNFKPEVVDLLEWSSKNLPESNHPDLCSDFVREFKKRFDIIKHAHNEPVNTV